MKPASDQIETTMHAGSIPTHFRVTSDGHSICSIPITVPPGTHKMQPKLSLLYASDLENGLLGMGWNLTGFSVITRTGQTMAQDNNWTAVNYTDSDRFALDGKRLVPLDFETIGQDLVYHTEIETWSIIVPVLQTGIEGAAGFKVTAKDGKKMEYGLDINATSRIMATGKNVVRLWALNRIEDLFGNYITITYINDAETGTYVPDQIDYTGNSVEGTLPQRSVKFDYEQRTDLIIQYKGGCRTEQTKRLKTISTFLDSQNVLTYTLDYQYSTLGGFSQLIKITLSDQNGIPLPPTNFEWTKDNVTLFNPAVTLTPPSTSDIPYQPIQTFNMDINGNGLNDLVIVWSDENNLLRYAIYYSTLDGFGDLTLGKPTQLNYYGATTGLQAVDIDGNGLGDLVYFFPGEDNTLQYVTFISNGKGFDVSGILPTGLSASENPRIIPIDITGNGASDIVIPLGDDGNLSLQVLLSNGTEYIPQLPAQITSFPILEGVYYINILPVNITGSPRQDLAYVYWDNEQVNIVSFISNGKGFEEGISFQYPMNNAGAYPLSVIPVNLNGDGLSDIAICRQTDSGLTLDILISDGNRICQARPELFSVQIPIADGYLIPMDITGDGRIDLMHVYPDYGSGMYEMVPYLCMGQGFEPAPALPKTFSISVGSINSTSLDGSGRTGLLYMNNPSGFDQTPQNWNLQWIKAGSGYPGFINSFKNGIGGEYNFIYESLAIPGVYQQSSSGPFENITQPGQISGLSQLANLSGMSIPVGQNSGSQQVSLGSVLSRRFMTTPLYVVTSIKKSDGLGHTYEKSYTYEGAWIDLTGRGWLGFSKRLITDKESNTKTVESFYQEFPFFARRKETAKLRLSDLSFLSTTKLEYLDQNKPPSGIHTALISKKTTNHFTYASADSDPDYTYVTSYKYDDFGNKKLKSVSNSYADKSCNGVYIDIEYYNDTVNHCLGYIKQIKVCSDAQLTKVLVLVNYERYPGTQAIHYKHIWVERTNSILTQTRAYDSFGNLITLTNTSNATKTFVFDKATHHTYPSVIHYPPNNQGKLFQKQFTYDLRFGVKISFTDANGIKKYNVLDNLGRVTEKHDPDLSGANFLYVQISRILSPNSGYCKVSKISQDWSASKIKIKKKYYDGLKRVFQQELYGQTGDSVSFPVKVITVWDERNRVIQKSQPFFDGQEPGFISKTYDPYGNLSTKTQPINQEQFLSTRYTYQSNIVNSISKISLQEEKTTQSVRKKFGTKKRVVNFVDGEGFTTQLQYDEVGRIKNISPPGEAGETISYDTANRKTSIKGDSFGQLVYTYDNTNKKVIITKSDGQTIVYTYDALGRRISVEHSSGTILSYDYDNPASAYGNLRLCNIQLVKNRKEVYSIKKDYYPNGKVSKQTLLMDGRQFITEYSYSPSGLITSIIAPNEAELKREYSDTGLLKAVSMRINTQADWILYAVYKDYTARRKPQTVEFPLSGVSNVYSYNSIGQLGKHTILHNNTPLRSDTFIVDDLARVKNITGNGNPAQYLYDKAGRLKSVTDTVFPDELYKYSASGNFLLKGNNSFAYTTNQISITNETNQQKTLYQFDQQGNLSVKQIGDTKLTFQFDELGRLLSVTDSNNGPLRSYCYNSEGIRLKITEHDTGQTIYQVHPWYKESILDNGTIIQELNIAGPTGLVANIAFSANGNSMPVIKDNKFIHIDRTGSVVLVTDTAGKVITTIQYNPYGTIYKIEGTDVFSKKFSSKEWDPATGLYYFNARYYDPELGRFISPDSRPSNKIIEHDVFNRYAFVLNNPINLQDPSGHGILEWLLYILEAVVGVVADLIPGVGEAVDAGIIGADVALEGAEEAGVVETLVEGEIGEEAVAVDEGVDILTTDVWGEVGEEAQADEVGEEAQADEVGEDAVTDEEDNDAGHDERPRGRGRVIEVVRDDNLWGMQNEFLEDPVEANNDVPIDNDENDLHHLLMELIRNLGEDILPEIDEEEAFPPVDKD